MDKQALEEVQKLTKKVDYWLDLMSGYRTFVTPIRKSSFPYIEINVPSTIQKLLHLRGGEIVEVKMKVLKYNDQ